MPGLHSVLVLLDAAAAPGSDCCCGCCSCPCCSCWLCSACWCSLLPPSAVVLRSELEKSCSVSQALHRSGKQGSRQEHASRQRQLQTRNMVCTQRLHHTALGTTHQPLAAGTLMSIGMRMSGSCSQLNR